MDYDITQNPSFGSDEYSNAASGGPFGSGFEPSFPSRNTNSLFYHHDLFWKGERPKEIHRTEKAILYEVDSGRFWVPKSLLKIKKINGKEITMVHKSFHRKYITQ